MLIKNRYIVAFIIIFVFALYYQKLSLYFLSDDFWLIFKFQNIKDVLGPSASYHVNPVPQFLIFYIGNLLAGLNAFYYHGITLLLHTINILLVFKLTEVLFHHKWTSMLSSLLYATYFMNYEVIYWVTGIYYILLTFFGLSSFLLFISYLNRRKLTTYLLFVATFTLTVFTMEQGFLLIGILALYEILIFSRSKVKDHALSKIFRSTIKYMPLLIIITLFFILKISMGQNFRVNEQSIHSSVRMFLGTLWYLFVPFPYSINNHKIIVLYQSLTGDYRIYLILLTIFVIISYLFIREYRDRMGSNKENELAQNSSIRNYLFLFCCILVYIIPQNYATIIQARYFYFPSIFSSIIFGNLFVTNLSKIVIPQKISSNYTMKIFHLIVILFIAVSVPVNIRFLKCQYRYWEQASIITKNIIKDTRLYLSDRVDVKNIYFVNLPDGIYKNNFGWPDAYVFRNGAQLAIRLSIPTKGIGAIKTYRTEENLPGLENPHGVRTWWEHSLVSMGQIRQLAEDKTNLILFYNIERQTVEDYSLRL